MRRVVVTVLAAGAVALSGAGLAQAHDFHGLHDPHHRGHHFEWFPHGFGFHHHHHDGHGHDGHHFGGHH